MITLIFIIFLTITLALIAFGHYIKIPPVQLSGFLFLFILGLVILTGNLNYQSGETQAYNYVCACCNQGIYTEQTRTEYSCIGTPNGCDTYDLDETACLSHNCSYDNETLFCSGTPYSCDQYTTLEDCDAVNCNWNGEAVGGCENGSITLKNITAAPVYSNYDNEIIQGVTIYHVLGLFLCLIAAFGFILTLVNLESFDVTKGGGAQ